MGEVYIIAGTVVSEVWRKPPMSPRALSRLAPVGGLIRSLTAVSSRPWTTGLMVILLPASQPVRLSVP